MRRAFTVLLTVAAVGLAGCGGDGAHSVASLIADEDALSGQRVAVTGVVQRLGAAEGATVEHFVLQDPDANRVKLLPEDAVVDYVSQIVRVEGVFEFSETTGRILQVERVVPLASG